MNADGLNFVVYDHENMRVTSSICFQLDHGEIKIVKEKKRPTALEEIQACSYIGTLAPKEGYVYFLAVMDEASGGLTDAVRMSMQKAGLKTDLTGQYRSSYYAVITADGIEEEAGYDRLHKEGYLEDGKTAYEIMSAGFDCGNDCSVKINGEEHALKKRGLNIVTYDEAKGCVVDSVCIDTCGDLQFYR